MPTWVPGTNCIISVDSTSGGSLVDYSDDISTATLDNNTTVGGFYTFGLAGEQTSEGQRSHSCSLGVRPSEDVAGFYYVLNAWKYPGSGTASGARSVRIQSPDATAGSYQFDFEAYPENWQALNGDASGDGTPPSLSLSLRVDGDVTLTIVT